MAKRTTAILVLGVSIAVLVQSYSSLQKLLSYETSLSSFTADLSTLAELPTIAICPCNQFDEKKVLSEGYDNSYAFIRGQVTLNQSSPDGFIGWGGVYNRSFENMTKYLNNDAKGNVIAFILTVNTSKIPIETRKIFLLSHAGFCFKLENLTSSLFSPGNNLRLQVSPGEYEILITDPGTSTSFALGESSMNGGILGNAEPNKSLVYQVDITNSVLDEHDPRSFCRVYSNSTKYPTFGECMEAELRILMNSTIGCSPPWMLNTSTTCLPGQLIPMTSEYKNLFYPYFKMAIWFKQTYNVSQCPLPCSTVSIGSKVLHQGVSSKFTNIDLVLNPKIAVYRTYRSYTYLSFLVDIGSYIGFWIGFSVLALVEATLLFIIRFGQKSHNKI